MPGGVAAPTSVVSVARREAWRRALVRSLALGVSVVTLAGCGLPLRRVAPDWQKSDHRLVGERLSQLLQAAGRDPQTCAVVFLETEHLNAASLGNCTFAFTTGLAATKDATLISGIAAHEVAHEILRHREKGDAAVTAINIADGAARGIPGWGPLASLGIVAVGMVALPTYSRTLEAEADRKAIEILQAAGDVDPAGTITYALETLNARERAPGGGLLGSHPETTHRLQVLRELQEPCFAPPPLERQAPAAVVSLPKPWQPRVYTLTTRPPDPRAGWSERYKKMVTTAEAQAKEAQTALNGAEAAK